MTQSSKGLGPVLARNPLTQKEIAAALGVAPETVTRWKRGDIAPGGQNLLRLLAFLRQHEPELQPEDLFAPEALVAPEPDQPDAA